MNKAIINFDDLLLKESFLNLFSSFNHRNLAVNLHFDILKSQNLLVKIQKFHEDGSLKDKIYNVVRL